MHGERVGVDRAQMFSSRVLRLRRFDALNPALFGHARACHVATRHRVDVLRRQSQRIIEVWIEAVDEADRPVEYTPLGSGAGFMSCRLLRSFRHIPLLVRPPEDAGR